ncbi:MAG: alpha/beta hydrolase superfamily protein [Erysipelotrichaceae bacterium]|nr:MAG: alpha/beta hydrolase superfamily [Erysipelotrichaceae bacterium]TXT16236.1 MAG: alpha/beta hydrolase superfamily protein [Erysipelotrichaceae bacterium]
MEFTYKDYSVYYETYGTGKPILILNGIMMSTLSWKPFIEAFSKDNCLILIDLLDQGKSSKLDGLTYNQDIQVDMLAHFIKAQAFIDLAVFGISYGGEVAIKLTIAYPQLVERLLLFNTTSHTSSWLQEIGYAWNKAASDPAAYYSTTIPVIYSQKFYEKHIEWMNRRKEMLLTVFANPVFIQAMIRLTNSANDLDERAHLKEIKCPTLVVGCEQDIITPFANQQFIAKEIPQAQLVYVPDSGHALMYEKPILFSSLVLGFTNNTKLEDVI